jgi:hypothetical protein
MVCAAALLAAPACSPANHWVLMRTLNANFSTQPHECVPLGWNPVPFDGKHFVPGESVEMQEPGTWIPAMWIGGIRTGASPKAGEVRSIAGVLDALVRAGLVARTGLRGRYRYHLTAKSLPYYFDQNQYGNNPDHLPYLCYSFVVPQAVVWSGPLHEANDGEARPVFGAEFAWRPSARAAWADDPVIRAHSVVLAPGQSPLLARVGRWGREWHVERIYLQSSSMPTVIDATAWPH